jgi:putative restriction endonuclease
MMIDVFSQWMRKNSVLSESSIYKYSHAVKTTSEEMVQRNVVQNSLFEMSLLELDIAIVRILNDPAFVQKNTIGNHMYSSSLKQFRYFILASFDTDESENKIIDSVISSEISTTEKETIIKARVGQGPYRNRLLDKFSGKCVVTGIDNPKLLVASHIKPWSICNNSERVDTENGLLLSANMDKLFDCGLITFTDGGKMFISSFVGRENEKRLHISNRVTIDLKATKTMLNYMEYHRDVLFVK